MEIKEIKKVVVELNDYEFEVLNSTCALLLRLLEKLQPNERLNCRTNEIITPIMLSNTKQILHSLIFVEEITQTEE